MRPSNELIGGFIVRMALAGAAAIAALVFWPLALALLVWLLFMPWEDAPDWVTPEKDEAEEEVKKGDAFWMWDR
jgi:hypothetical protein